ncbi:MAG: acetyl-CoA C-acetyltransferase [Gammaproteobacteria bacterium]|nr:acetyl-CoA C-acetyltransferase [Gammaproteobacteria bacterium]
MTARVFIVDGARTPFLKARNEPGPFSAAELALIAGRALMSGQAVQASDLDHVILGCVIPAPDEANIARIVGLRLGTGVAVPAFTVQRNCASGLQALATAFDQIRAGRAHLVLAGGTEAMSRAPIQWNGSMSAWLAQMRRARTPIARARALMRLRPAHLRPVFSLLLGLSDPVVGLSMGQTAEIVAARFGIDRRAQDAYALESHQRVLRAQEQDGFRDEIETAYEPTGRYHAQDDGVRADSDLEQLARLKPAFERPFGSVTSGNSSQITDGAALLLLASEEAVYRHDLPVIAEILDHDWAGVDPAQMGLGPVHATARLLARQQLRIDDMAHVELNEAFAGQVLACQAAFASAAYARDELGLDQPLGAIDATRLNPDGGAIAIGHPVGATGARLVLHLAKALRRRGGGLGLATLCIGGGQGGAMLVRSTESAKGAA